MLGSLNQLFEFTVIEISVDIEKIIDFDLYTVEIIFKIQNISYQRIMED